MPSIEELWEKWEGKPALTLALRHRELQTRPTSARVGDESDNMLVIKLIMWNEDAVAVSPEWACDTCKNSKKPCLRMTIAGLTQHVVRDQELIFLREYAYNCILCIRRKCKCNITRIVIDEAHPAPGKVMLFDRNGPSDPGMAVPKTGLVPKDEKIVVEHAQHSSPILGYDEVAVKRYLKSLRKTIKREHDQRNVSAEDRSALVTRGSILAFVEENRAMLQKLYDRFTSISAAMKPVLDHASTHTQRKTMAASICRDFSKTLFKAVRKILDTYTSSDIHNVDADGDHLVCYRIRSTRAEEFHHKVLGMLADDPFSTDEDMSTE